MPSTVVVAAVFRRGDTYLACRRSAGRQNGGLWEFPGGKVEEGESHAQALAREVGEELGVRVNVGAPLCRTAARAGGMRIDLITFEVTPVDQYPVRSDDHDELRWVAPNELHTLDWAPADLPTVSLLIAKQPHGA